MAWARLVSSTSLRLAALFVCAIAVGPSACSANPETPAVDPSDGGDAEASVEKNAPDAGAAPPIGPAVECTIGAAIEQEPNDTPATANAFTELSFCGVLDSGSDVDYATFDTPTGKKLTVFQGIVTGKVDFQLMLNGATFGPTETDKFGAGTYVVKAFTTAGKPAAYRFRVQFD